MFFFPTVKDESQDEAVGEPGANATAGKVLRRRALEVFDPLQHVHRGPAVHGHGDEDQPQRRSF